MVTDPATDCISDHLPRCNKELMEDILSMNTLDQKPSASNRIYGILLSLVVALFAMYIVLYIFSTIYFYGVRHGFHIMLSIVIFLVGFASTIFVGLKCYRKVHEYIKQNNYSLFGNKK